jgi:hypothetical protein
VVPAVIEPDLPRVKRMLSAEPGGAALYLAHIRTDAAPGSFTVDYWDFNSLVAFAPPNHFENLADADTSWVFDATALV